MSRVYTYAFLLAVAAAAVIGFTTSAAAQESKKEQSAKKKSSLEGSDAKMMREMIQSDLAEVQAGKLAASKASSDEVKKYGQHMVDEHGKHLKAAQEMAKKKGLQAPTSPAKKHQDAAKKLQQASGAEFDRMFMRQMVKDHEDALKLVQNAAKKAKDADLKADAENTAPVIEKHLEEAKRIAASLK